MMLSLLVVAAGLAQDAPLVDAPSAPEAPAPADAPPVAPAEGGPDPLWTAISAHYGEDVPKDDFCTVTPTLPDIFQPVVVVAKKTMERGCVVDGVMVANTWKSLEEAPAAALVPEKFKAAALTAKGDAFKAWTQGVLLAWETPEPTAAAPTVKAARPTGWEVGATFWHRTENWHQMRKVAGKFTFDATGKMVKADRATGENWTSTFYTQPFKIVGAVSEAEVAATLEQQGKTLAECFHNAWLKDPFVKGRARIQWSIESTKPTKFAVADPAMGDLNNCYAKAIKKVQFSEGATGTVIWSFSIDRRLDTP